MACDGSRQAISDRLFEGLAVVEFSQGVRKRPRREDNRCGHNWACERTTAGLVHTKAWRETRRVRPSIDIADGCASGWDGRGTRDLSKQIQSAASLGLQPQSLRARIRAALPRRSRR